MFFDQQGFGVRSEWGEAGVRELAPFAEAVVIVDVLSFTTCVDIALSRGASVLPYRWKDDSVTVFAEQHGAIAASRDRRFAGGFSLSPTSLLNLRAGMKLVLLSPNGATLCALAEEILPGRVFAACLRNAEAVGRAVGQQYQRVLVVPAGERWANGSLRPALEDWLGAGAVIQALGLTCSPETEAARQAFLQAQANIAQVVKECSSGRELIERGFGEDVELAAEPNVSQTVPLLRFGAFEPLNSGA